MTPIHDPEANIESELRARVQSSDLYKAIHARMRWRHEQRTKWRSEYLILGVAAAALNYDGRPGALAGSVFAGFCVSMVAWQLGSGFFGWRYWYEKDRYKPSDPRRRRSRLRF